MLLPQDKLVKIAKKLKKNNVAVDIVSFGAEEVRHSAWTRFTHRCIVFFGLLDVRCSLQ